MLARAHNKYLNIAFPLLDAPKMVDLGGWLRTAMTDETFVLSEPILQAYAQVEVTYEDLLALFELRLGQADAQQAVRAAALLIQAAWRSLNGFLKGLMSIPDVLRPGVAVRTETMRKAILPDGLAFINRSHHRMLGDATRRYQRLQRELSEELEALGGLHVLGALQAAHTGYDEARSVALDLRAQLSGQNLKDKMQNMMWAVRNFVLQVIAWAAMDPAREETAERLLRPLDVLTDSVKKNSKKGAGPEPENEVDRSPRPLDVLTDAVKKTSRKEAGPEQVEKVEAKTASSVRTNEKVETKTASSVRTNENRTTPKEHAQETGRGGIFTVRQVDPQDVLPPPPKSNS